MNATNFFNPGENITELFILEMFTVMTLSFKVYNKQSLQSWQVSDQNQHQLSEIYEGCQQTTFNWQLRVTLILSSTHPTLLSQSLFTTFSSTLKTKSTGM